MGHSISHYVRMFVADYGYWAVAVALLCENACSARAWGDRASAGQFSGLLLNIGCIWDGLL